MKSQRIKSFRFLMGFFLPVAGVALLAGVLNWVSFASLRDDYLQSTGHQEADSRQIAALAGFNHRMAVVQIEVGDILIQAAAGKADAAQIDRFRTEIENRLSELQQVLADFPPNKAYQNALVEAQGDLVDYKKSIFMASDLAVLDPVAAMRHAFSASQAQVRVAEHAQWVANVLASEIAEHSQTNARAFARQALQTGAIGAAVLVVVMLLWLWLAQRLTRRLSQLSGALSALSHEDTHSPTLVLVTRLSQQKSSLLSDMAVSVLAFKDSVMSGKKTRYDLSERMKELSCLYDVKALTENRLQDRAEMLNAVAHRLAGALRYPQIAEGWVDYQGRRYGSHAAGEHLSVRFGGTDAQPDLLGITYTAPLPDDAGETFLPEEVALFAAMAKRMSDVMEIRRAEAALAQSDRALRTARECAQMLIRAQEEDKLMQDICSLAVEVGGYRMAWVGLAENDAEHSVRPVASAGFEDDYLVNANISWADTERGRGPTGFAIRERRSVVARHVLTSPDLAPWRDAAVQRGYGSAIALPLMADGDHCLGALSLYAQEDDAFSDAEMDLLNEMANDLSFGIRTLRARAALNSNMAEMRKLSLVVEQSPNSIIITNLEPSIEYVNDAFVRNTGFSRDAVMGHNPRLLKSGKTPDATFLNMWSTLASGNTWTGEFINKAHDGQEQIEVAIIVPLIQSDGQISHYVAIKEDVTEKKRMAHELLRYREHLEALVVERTEALARKEEELRLLLESTSEGIYGCDADGQITFANTAALEMLQYADAAELVGQPNHATLHHSHADGSPYPVETCVMQRAMQNNEVVHCDTEVYWRRDGTCFPVAYAAAPLVRNSAVVGMVVAFQDITERKRTEALLLEAKAAAEAATRSKSDFLANMSHEIRTPMNAIIGMSHLALKTDLDKKQRNYIEKVHRSGENLLGIINDILDFSKIEAGKMGMESVDFNVDDVMDNLANLVTMKTEDKGLELLFDIAPDVPATLVGDPLRLGQVLINLGNNAAKFTEHGEIIIGIQKVADHADGVELHFWVRDTGIGMTAEQCEKMFESFSQADASTTRKYGGTGLGLAISKNLVKAMRGRMWVQSVPGQGSTFHFHARFGVQTRMPSRRMFSADELLGVRVLVVDDNAAAREILSTMAKSFGLAVDVAHDGAEALQRVALANQHDEPYELVLMDWKMPAMDGVQAVRHLRQDHISRVPTVIMVTAYGREDAMASASELGVTLQTVLTKPVTPSTLLEAIGEALCKGTEIITRKEARIDGSAEAILKIRGARLLLVEDNDLNQELAMELLTNAGMAVVLAQHGQEALDILARDPRFDGVLMDCQMPVMDGYTATREIRKNPNFAKLPIIAMTANAMAGDKDKVLAAGMWDHIAKPLNVEAMFATLARWIHPAAASKPPIATHLIATSPINTWATGTFDSISLPGIDTHFGLATALNRDALYRRLLRKFRDGQSDFAAQFALARTATDVTAAQRCAHTLRGTAGTIGAKGVQDAATALEHACETHEPTARIDALLHDLLAELEPVLQGLQGLQGLGIDDDAGTPAAPPQNIDTEKLADVRQALLTLLDRGDSGALDLCEQHDDLLRAAYPTHWKKILDSMNGFDFEAARSRLQDAH